MKSFPGIPTAIIPAFLSVLLLCCTMSHFIEDAEAALQADVEMTGSNIDTPSGAFMQMTTPGLQYTSLPIEYSPEPVDPVNVPRFLKPQSDGSILLATFPTSFKFDNSGNILASFSLEPPTREMVEEISEFRVWSNTRYDCKGFLDIAALFDSKHLSAISATNEGKIYGYFADDWFHSGVICEWEPDGSIVRVISSEDLPTSGKNSLGEQYRPANVIASDGNRLIFFGEAGNYVIIENGIPGILTSLDEWSGTPDWVVLYDEYIYENSPPYRLSRNDIIGIHDTIFMYPQIAETDTRYYKGIPIIDGQSNYSCRGIGVLPDGSRIEFWREDKRIPDEQGRLYDDTIPDREEMIEFDRDGSEINRTPYQSWGDDPENPLMPFEHVIFDCVKFDDGYLFFDRCVDGESATAVKCDLALARVGEVEFVVPVEEPVQSVSQLLVGAKADMELIGKHVHLVKSGFRSLDSTGNYIITFDENLVITDMVEFPIPGPDDFWRYGIDNISDFRMDDSGVVYILDAPKGVLLAVEPDGSLLWTKEPVFSVPGSDPFFYFMFSEPTRVDNTFLPKAIELDWQGNLWVRGDTSIWEFDSLGNEVKKYITGINRPDAADIEDAVHVKLVKFSELIVPPWENSGTIGIVDATQGYILLLDCDGNEAGRIDLLEIEGTDRKAIEFDNGDGPQIPMYSGINEYDARFSMGPDGKIYYFIGHIGWETEGARLLAFDETGMHICEVIIYDVPYGGWSWMEFQTWIPGMMDREFNEVWIDDMNRLVISQPGKALTIYPLHVDDPLEQYQYFTDIYLSD